MADELAGFDAKVTYDAAAEAYEDASRGYWQYLSRRTVARLGLKPGEAVLDVACGTGPAAVEAAQAVGEATVRARCNRFVEEHRGREVVLRGPYAVARKA